MEELKDKNHGKHQKKFQDGMKQSRGNKVKGNVAAVKATEGALKSNVRKLQRKPAT